MSKRKCRIAIGGISFEGNSLSPQRTNREQFEKKYLKAGSDIITDLAGTTTEHAGAIAVLQLRDAEIIPLLATHGAAGGQVTRACWQELKAE